SSMITRTRILIGASIALGAVLAAPLGLDAWGDVGHTITGGAAAAKLPSDMPAFFRGAGRQLAYLNPEPDRWRDRAESTLDPAMDGAYSPEHYVDMDLATPAVLASALAARNRYAYFDSLSKGGVKGATMGLLPFRILELSQLL